MSQKDIATEFLALAASGRAKEAFARYASDGFRHHNGYFPGDADSLMTAMDENAKQFPNKTLDVKIAVEEGDKVATFSKVVHTPGEKGAAVVHIFRFADGKIAELWDVGQAVPDDSPNEYGMF
jgi:predicted SnoaL-like aldol condensation-catalyzing enzyme